MVEASRMTSSSDEDIRMTSSSDEGVNFVRNDYLESGDYEYKNGEYVRRPGLDPEKETFVEHQTRLAKVSGSIYSKYFYINIYLFI